MEKKADISELAVATWRLEKWLEKLNSDRKMAARSSLRLIKKYLADSEVEIKDPTGAKFDPGLALEVVNNEAEEVDENQLKIIETIIPYVYQRGNLIQRAKVIIGINDKNEMKENIEDNSDDKIDKPIQNNITRDDKNADKEFVTINEKDIERVMNYAKNI